MLLVIHATIKGNPRVRGAAAGTNGAPARAAAGGRGLSCYGTYENGPVRSASLPLVQRARGHESLAGLCTRCIISASSVHPGGHWHTGQHLPLPALGRGVTAQ